MSDKIEVGDKVTWRSSPNALAMTGCIVLSLGKTADEQEAAELELGRFGTANALVAHLIKEVTSP